MTAWTYRIFGLDVRFPREVPTLRGARTEHCPRPDVHVVFAPVPARATMETVNEDLDVAWEGDELTITVEDVGRFLVHAGRVIVVDPYPGVGRPEVDLYLAGSVMGAVLHQRGMLPLHCNGFAQNDRAILLCGDSGAGKSTLAAWFEARGHPLLTDDVCAVTFPDEGTAIGHPGVPRLRLWHDALIAMNRSAEVSCAIPWAEGKFELEMDSLRARSALPIAAIYHLENPCSSGRFAITPLGGLAAVDAITSNIYRRRIGDLVGRSSGYLHDAVRLSAAIPMFRISRAWGMEELDWQSREIELHANNIPFQNNYEISLTPSV